MQIDVQIHNCRRPSYQFNINSVRMIFPTNIRYTEQQMVGYMYESHLLLMATCASFIYSYNVIEVGSSLRRTNIK